MNFRREVKPRTKSELVSGIQRFWNRVDVQKCNKYINYLANPQIIKLDGGATGFWFLYQKCANFKGGTNTIGMEALP